MASVLTSPFEMTRLFLRYGVVEIIVLDELGLEPPRFSDSEEDGDGSISMESVCLAVGYQWSILGSTS